ncbi:MAG: DUF4118 domain-containing protein, partial [Armatimonadetes bacterium]|nr:DUF4118 domain-containing protein [Armatimonadota bacterium]
MAADAPAALGSSLEVLIRRYLPGLLGVAAITAVLSIAENLRHLANVSMLYLLVVIAVAVGQGRGPALAAAVVAFLAFDWFLVEPLHQLAVSEASEWIVLLLFLVTGTVIGQLTGRLQAQATAAARREGEAAALSAASWAVASQVDLEHALAEVLRRVVAV